MGHNEVGEMFVYFGCRHQALDYLYANELDTLVKENAITGLYTSFSRDSDDQKYKYVQVSDGARVHRDMFQTYAII